jgi:2,4-diaminopentanoate dehydrogenase
MPYRVVVWSTGGVGSIAVQSIARRSDLDLVGVWVHSPEKVDVDAGVLTGGAPIGVAATNDVEALVALAPDCVCYAATGPELDAAANRDYVRFLEARTP